MGHVNITFLALPYLLLPYRPLRPAVRFRTGKHLSLPYGLRHLCNSATLAKKTSFAISKVQEGAISIYLVTRHPENPSIMSFNNRKFSMNKYTGVPRPSASNNGQPKARRFSTNEPSSQGPVHCQDLTTIDADILQNVTLPYTSNSETLTRDTKVSMLFPERRTYY